MNAITFGDPNLFVKGMVEATVADPETGNIIGYDNVASEGAVTSSFNAGEITGGFGNPLLITIPDTARISGTLTSQAFNLQQRALASGGTLDYGGTAPVCETITASGTSLTVSKTPVKAYGQPSTDTYGWCYVRESGATSYSGANYGIDLSSGTVQGFSAVSGTSYDVFYFTAMASAQVLALPTMFAPKVATLTLKFGVYAKQNGSTSNGTLNGYLYFVVPRAEFTGDVGLNASQTANATTAYDWTAVTDDSSSVMKCADCDGNSSDYAYYVYVPCAGATSAVVGLAVIGGNMTVTADTATQIPVVYIMPDDSTQTPVYTDMTYTVASAATSDLTVSTDGKATAQSTLSAGDGVVTIALKSDTSITTTVTINVAS